MRGYITHNKAFNNTLAMHDSLGVNFHIKQMVVIQISVLV